MLGSKLEQQLYDIAVALDQPFIVEQLAAAAGVAITTVKPRVREMVTLGSLTVDKRQEGSGTPRHYYTCTDRQPDHVTGDASAAA